MPDWLSASPRTSHKLEADAVPGGKWGSRGEWNYGTVRSAAGLAAVVMAAVRRRPEAVWRWHCSTLCCYLRGDLATQWNVVTLGFPSSCSWNASYAKQFVVYTFHPVGLWCHLLGPCMREDNFKARIVLLKLSPNHAPLHLKFVGIGLWLHFSWWILTLFLFGFIYHYRILLEILDNGQVNFVFLKQKVENLCRFTGITEKSELRKSWVLDLVIAISVFWLTSGVFFYFFYCTDSEKYRWRYSWFYGHQTNLML